MANYRYGRYVYGPDPLALPFDVRGAVDEMGDAILAGANPADALREMLRRGLGDQAGRRGLGVEQVVVEAIDTGALAGCVPVAAQIDGEQFDARGVQPLGERRGHARFADPGFAR